MNNINMQPIATQPGPETGVVKGERSYHELPGLRSEPKDVLKQLQANLSLLEDQCGRMNFLLGEVRSAIRR